MAIIGDHAIVSRHWTPSCRTPINACPAGNNPHHYGDHDGDQWVAFVEIKVRRHEGHDKQTQSIKSCGLGGDRTTGKNQAHYQQGQTFSGHLIPLVVDLGAYTADQLL